MPQSLLTGQLKEKPTYRVWCLYSSLVHGVSSSKTYYTFTDVLLYPLYLSICLSFFYCNTYPIHTPLHCSPVVHFSRVCQSRHCNSTIPPAVPCRLQGRTQRDCIGKLEYWHCSPCMICVAKYTTHS